MAEDKAQKEEEKGEGARKTEAALREEAVLAFWNEHDIFKKSLEKDAPNGEYVFYDGPPFATGLPHYGHILASTIKDAIPRYQTMRGKRVARKWGWDCHGLPLENLIEKRLGLKTKKDIEELGVEQFNETARDAVLEYADDWRRIIPRMGRWADMDDDYKTMDSTYTESVWWVFKQLHEKGLVFEGFKSMHLCPRCGTTLSNFEVNLGYADIKDVAVTVTLPFTDDPETALLVWTTTPWTLPGNMAAAVHKDHTYIYAKIENADTPNIKTVVLARERADAVLGEGQYEIEKEVKGSELLGKAYEPPFSYYKDMEFEHKANAWKVYHADYVEIGDEGTGAVHLAPAYGEDDMELAKREGVPIIHHVGEDGRFLDHVTDFAGKLVKPRDEKDGSVTHLDTDIEVLRALKDAGKIFKKENITHSYPHCWRCDTPLLNYATTSWFVDVPKIKDKLVLENNKVHWVPEHVGSARFGKWLEGARDWAVSRQRYWGAPLPIWRNPKTKEFKVFGSLAEIKKYTKRSGNAYFLMRHGKTNSNGNGIVSGDINAEDPLTDEGVRQVSEAIPKLKEHKIDLIIASPFQRSKMTAKMVAEALDIDESAILYDDRIGEIQTNFHGRPIAEYHKMLDDAPEWYTAKIEGGESWDDVRKRVGEFLYDIERTHHDKNILIIGHNCPLRMMGAVNDGLALSGTAFDHDQDGMRYENAEVRELPFTPLPHNREYVLDFHRPYIDELKLVDEDGTRLERVPDVFDCWFESGSMPYGQQHHPFEHLDVFDPEKGKGYPADFIAEGLDQTRGWFYSLIVLGTALFGKSPYRNVIVNGLVLAEDGKKMSKSLQNYPDPMDVADKYGVDTMRFYLLSSPIMKAEDLNFSEKGLSELARKNIGRLHNVLSFYDLYKDDSIAASSDSDDVLDRWIIARIGMLVRDVTDGFETYELDRATRPITDFIDDLSVWYVRRSRDRMKEVGMDRTRALTTLRYVLKALAKVMAPSMPFYAEHLYHEMRSEDEPESVHLCDWPATETVDTDTLKNMEAVREIVTIALEARARANIKVRQPLPKLEITKVAAELHHLIKDEVNVKEIVVGDAVVLDTTLTPELEMEGDAREFMRQVQAMRKDAGLMPQDAIELVVYTDDDGRNVLETHKNEIMRITNANAITYEEHEGATLSVGENTFVVTLKR